MPIFGAGYLCSTDSDSIYGRRNRLKLKALVPKQRQLSVNVSALTVSRFFFWILTTFLIASEQLFLVAFFRELEEIWDRRLLFLFIQFLKPFLRRLDTLR